MYVLLYVLCPRILASAATWLSFFEHVCFCKCASSMAEEYREIERKPVYEESESGDFDNHDYG
jgi:hypothetical protein